MPQACGRVMKRPAAPGADACERADVGDLVGPALTPALSREREREPMPRPWPAGRRETPSPLWEGQG